jgi:hypothetical protein
MLRALWPALAFALLLAPRAQAAELILPQNRTAFYSTEPVELAVAGLKKGEKTALDIVPASKGLKTHSFPVPGNGSTVLAVLPAGALAPSAYTLRLGGKDAGKITVSAGGDPDTVLMSATVGNPRQAGANFLLGNAFGFGLLDPLGQPAKDLRGRRSSGMQAFDNAVRDNLPTVVYMYWTGYVTHKPFGSEKSWAAKDMMEATRLLSFHTAQRLRRYNENIVMVGTLDEPGLSWGKTPAGGMASGFPNQDEEEWYAKRGWKYTQDPASRPAADWMKYMTVRCAIMKEVDHQAKKDLKSIWPEMKFSTDLYAPQAVMDGTDPLNQQINDIPSSHVFLDWGVGKLGGLSGLYLEKAHHPTSKIAHAMNGQLFSASVPQPNQRNSYRLMLNAMLASGLYSNWWLNPTGMTNEDLAWVNEPVSRLGPLFHAFDPKGHDVAVLWSFTEICMREKDVTAREAKKKTGEQIKLMIASLPDIPGAKDKLVDINAYNVGGNYKEQVLSAHQALARAGYPAHILHERILNAKVLDRYKTLVIVGQTFDLPADLKKIIDLWTVKGGTVIVDETSKVKFERTVVTKADFRDPAFRWGAYFGLAEKKDHPFKNNREASLYHTNYFMDEQVRKAVAPLKESMKKTRSQPAIDTDSIHLAAEKHTFGPASLYMVINAFEKLPDIAADKRYWLYNYAPHETTFTLKGIKPGSAVYCIEGQDWKKAREVKDADKPQKASFEPGEMKLYLVVPRRPTQLRADAVYEGGQIVVRTSIADAKGSMKVPWPVAVTLSDPAGKEMARIYRSTALGAAVFSLGTNSPAGEYTARITSPLGGLSHERKVKVAGEAVALRFNNDTVRVFDQKEIQEFLRKKPALVVAYSDVHKEAATKLAADLTAAGIKTTAKPEKDVLRKVPYPRVWNPFAMVYAPDKTDPVKVKKGLTIKNEITLGVDKAGTLTAKTADGKDVSQDWRLPNSLVTITGEGFVDFGGDRELCYEAGVKLYFDERRQMKVLNAEAREVQTTAAFRKKWAKPWSRLTTHVGAYQLPAQLPEAWTTDSHLILLGDGKTSPAVAALQASEILPQAADDKYPGPGKALLQIAWSPFAVEKNVLFIGAADKEGVQAGIARLLKEAR